ncbi:MAG: adenosine kinase [Rikenellaceae bacterium]|jgi:sugar/nucleoside kinase (ribokinase family)|nr:adenosine kinase [Rikenellaceae bacterium]
MSYKEKRILGIGNALVDILTHLDDDSVLETLNFPRGSMNLVGRDTQKQVEELIRTAHSRVVTGGSAANTIRGLARLDVGTGYIGKIGRDAIGAYTEESLRTHDVASHLIYSDTPSGRCVVLIDAEGERTMVTYLGAAVEMCDDEIDDDNLAGYDYLFIEGYLVQSPALIEGAMRKAKASGLIVALDMASFNVVEGNREFLSYLILTYVDIVFANEDEARGFAGREPAEALGILTGMCDIAVVKVGAEGSIIGRGAERWAVPAAGHTVVDTTGAGDLYAAGFLYGLSMDMAPDRCGHIGALIANQVIQTIGPAIDETQWPSLRDQIQGMVR